MIQTSKIKPAPGRPATKAVKDVRFVDGKLKAELLRVATKYGDKVNRVAMIVLREVNIEQVYKRSLKK